MKNSGEIRQKVKQVRYRYLKKALDRKLRTSPIHAASMGSMRTAGISVASTGWQMRGGMASSVMRSWMVGSALCCASTLS